MLLNEILSHPAKVLSEEQRQHYFEDGYLHLPRFVGMDWVQRLRAVAAEFVECSRHVTESSDAIFVEPGHTPDNPRLLRLNQAVNHHPLFWAFATDSILPDLAVDLVGPDVKFRESTINYKWADGGSRVHWHQDIPFFPHTNLNLFVAITYLEDVGPDQAPLKVLRGSHRGEIFHHRDRSGQWLGRISDEDLTATLEAVAGVLPRGGTFGIDLVPELPRWQEYHRRVGLRGAMSGGRRVTLIESVRQVPEHGLTVFEQEFLEWRGRSRTVHRFSLAFRTVTVPQVAERLERAGFRVDAVLGDYAGEEWSPDADVWVIIARRS